MIQLAYMGNMKKLIYVIAICTLLPCMGCSMLITTPKVASIKIHGIDNRLNEYLVVLDPEYSEHMIGIQISDRYALNLDFEWLIDATIGFDEADIPGQPCEDIAVSPWMMCTYKF